MLPLNLDSSLGINVTDGGPYNMGKVKWSLCTKENCLCSLQITVVTFPFPDKGG